MLMDPRTTKMDRPSRKVRSKERRRWKRVDMTLSMRFLDERGRECEGETLNVSGGGIMFSTPTPPLRGDRVVCYLEDLGRVSGHIVRSQSGICALVSDAPLLKRDRFTDQITWHMNKRRLGLTEERRAERQPGGGAVIVKASDGREIKCHVLDMSLVGVGLATKYPKPMLGEIVQVGPQKGRVARYLPEGFAVDFTR